MAKAKAKNKKTVARKNTDSVWVARTSVGGMGRQYETLGELLDAASAKGLKAGKFKTASGSLGVSIRNADGKIIKRYFAKSKSQVSERNSKKAATKKNPFGLSTASEALSLLDHIRQKNPAIKLSDGTVLHGKMVNVFLKEAKRQNPKSKRNIEMGYWSGGQFHPIRASIDYSPAAVGESFHHAPTSRSAKRLMDKKRAGKNPNAKKPAKKNAAAPTNYKIAMAAGQDAGNRSMKAAGRTKWSKADFNAAAKTFSKVMVIAGKAARNPYLMLVNKGKPKTGAKRSEAKRKKRNSDGLYEEFHGMDSTRTDVIDLPDSAPAKTERLGDRVKIFYQKDGERIEPSGSDREGITKSFINLSRDCFLESNSEGDKYFIGAKPGCLPVFTKNGTFGPATRIEYWARKPHLENGDKNPRPYFHVLGEESGKRPVLKTDKDGLLIFSGGDYHTNRYGINN